jgi:flagellar motor protein MotB
MSDYDRLRQLLLAEERDKLQSAERRIAELEQVNSELAAALPTLVRAAPAEPMTRALARPVASALGSAVRDNRASIVDALFPVIGPIIRKAIAEALRGLMSDLNRVLEYGFSPRGIRWRLEAWRSGVPFAQIVLRHTLRYRIDHVFLIERDSGLVLHRRSAPNLPDLDGDAIAGMLTAIGQFVRDSVGRGEGDALEAARVGEHLLWVIEGPRASLACFLSGVPPHGLRGILSDRLEQIHAGFPPQLDSDALAASGASVEWDAALDPAALEASSAALGGQGVEGTHKASRWPLLLVVLLALAALAWHFARIERWNHRVETLRAQLLDHPGFLLGRIDSRPWRELTVHGLVDADAEPLAPLLERVDFGDVEPRLELDGFVSSADAVVVNRAKRLLQPPAGVRLRVAGGVLEVEGEARSDWIDANRERIAWIAGVREVDWRVHAIPVKPANPEELPSARDEARSTLLALADELAALRVEFGDDVEPAGDQAGQVRRMAAIIGRAEGLRDAAGMTLALRIRGHTDASGSEATNRALRVQRADWLRDRLRQAGVSGTLLQESGMADQADEGDPDFRGASVRLTTLAGGP